MDTEQYLEAWLKAVAGLDVASMTPADAKRALAAIVRSAGAHRFTPHEKAKSKEALKI